MAITEEAFRAHLNMTADEAAVIGASILTRLLAAATAHTEAQLGFKLTDTTQFPAGPPDDVEQAVLMLAAHWFSQREATVVGVAMMAIPFGFEEIIASHRRYTFG